MHQSIYRSIATLILLTAGLYGTPASAGKPESRLEQSICGFKEPIAFWLWSMAAGEADPARLAQFPAVQPVSITSRDGRILHGYRLAATPAADRENRTGAYLLVAQGNAMLADQIIMRFGAFADSGYDVYVFDYRGNGRSEGKRRLKAILNDYREIIAYLDAQSYQRRAFYGLSFGGAVLLDALRNQPGTMSVVIDSTPSRLSDYGCPRAHDPLTNLPRDARRFLFIAGTGDRVVTPEAAAELLDTAARRDALVIRDPALGHPFMDGHTDRRLAMIQRFLSGEDARGN